MRPRLTLEVYLCVNASQSKDRHFQNKHRWHKWHKWPPNIFFFGPRLNLTRRGFELRTPNSEKPKRYSASLSPWTLNTNVKNMPHTSPGFQTTSCVLSSRKVWMTTQTASWQVCERLEILRNVLPLNLGAQTVPQFS